MYSLALTRRIPALFRVHPGEGTLVAVMVVYSMAAFGGVLTVGYSNLAWSIFLSRLPASATPYAFILPAGAIVLTYAVYNTLASRFRLSGLAVGSAAVPLLAALAFRVLLLAGLGTSFPLITGIYLYCEVAASLVITQFWTFAGQFFDPRQARRLFGVIAAGGTVGSMSAGLMVAALVRSIGLDNLLFIVAANLGVCGVCAATLGRRLPAAFAVVASTGGQPPARRSSLGDTIAAIWRLPLLRSIAGITILVSLIWNVGAFEFFLALQSRFTGHGSSLAGFLGTLAIWTGLAALAMQLTGTGSIMVRFGIFAAQAVFPLFIATAAGATLLTQGAFWGVVLIGASDPVFRRTMHDASLNALYLPGAKKGTITRTGNMTASKERQRIASR